MKILYMIPLYEIDSSRFLFISYTLYIIDQKFKIIFTIGYFEIDFYYFFVILLLISLLIKYQ